MSGKRGEVKIYIFLKSIYPTLSPCKISAHSDNFEFWPIFLDPPKIRGRGNWAGSMTVGCYLNVYVIYQILCIFLQNDQYKYYNYRRQHQYCQAMEVSSLLGLQILTNDCINLGHQEA